MLYDFIKQRYLNIENELLLSRCIFYCHLKSAHSILNKYIIEIKTSLKQ